MRRVLAVLIGALTLFGGVADAHVVSYASKIRQTETVIDGNDVEFIAGFVRSQKASCRRNRVVVVRYKESGEDPELLGVDITDLGGRWEIDEDGPTGEIYTFIVRRRVAGSGSHRHVCERDTASALFFGD
jgi:hypothetical protein